MIFHIIQARLGSERFPKKTIQKIAGKTLLEHHIERTMSKDFRQIVIMPPQDRDEMKKYPYGREIDFHSDLGDRDLLGAYFRAAVKNGASEGDWIVRTTADCPFIDTAWFIKTIGMAQIYDMPIFNCFKEGSSTEVFKFEHLKRAHEELPAIDQCDEYQRQCREHCTKYFIHGFEKESIDTKADFDREKVKYERA